jgi:hypothetical protein
MSYKVEEIEGENYYSNSNGEKINEPVNIQYYTLYSKIQRKRNQQVLRQLKDIWREVIQQISFIRCHIDTEEKMLKETEFYMSNLYKLFLITSRSKADYYNEEKINKRRDKKYISKQINKLKLKKSKL